MLNKALERLKSKDRPIQHSDQGWHYHMPTYQRRLQARDIAQSMSRKVNCLDNAAIESFFAVLKSEFFHPNRFDSIHSLEDGTSDYTHYCNHHRIKMKLKGLRPVRYRTQSLLAHQPSNLWGSVHPISGFAPTGAGWSSAQGCGWLPGCLGVFASSE